MNEERIKKRIRALLDEIHSEADPVLLNRCRSIFRKEVSFFSRSYMAAYLLLLAEGVDTKKPAAADPGTAATASRSRGRASQRSAVEQPERAISSQVLSEDESVQLFVSVGRNRRVFSRELLALVFAKAKVSREDIGAIRTLDNYSFVQVRNSVADTVIQALNGQSYRGRTLTVNYARSRRETEDALAENNGSAEA